MEIHENVIVVENNNIGYNIRMPLQMIDRLPGCGSQVKIYTYLYVREDAYMLYGFLTRDDLNVFQLLIGVSGIGPKGAQAILSVLTTDELRFAVLSDDAKTISKAPGIGGKTAQRLIIELKDKMKIEDVLDDRLHGDEPEVVATSDNSSARKDAIEALTALGYSGTEALQAVKRVKDSANMTVEQLLKESLKHMYD